MPELPEVETIKRDLEEKIINKKVRDIWVDDGFTKKVFPNLRTFLSLRGKSFRHLRRKAKLLIFETNDDLFLLNHLKMTGQLVYREKNGRMISGGHTMTNIEDVPNRFTRVIFSFADGAKLYFNDLRKFGFFRLVSKKDLGLELAKYGVEPLDVEFSFEFFNEYLNKKKNLRLKTILLDQKYMSGLGNIYVDESCFAAKIKPTRLVKSLSLLEKKELFKQIKKILEKAITHRGTSVNTYRGADGEKGNFQNFLMVYGRTNELCKRCKKAKIEAVKIGGRTTRFCPACQR
jgi:formamidopyrimidine-DNA glycosylase